MGKELVSRFENGDTNCEVVKMAPEHCNPVAVRQSHAKAITPFSSEIDVGLLLYGHRADDFGNFLLHYSIEDLQNNPMPHSAATMLTEPKTIDIKYCDSYAYFNITQHF